MMRIPPRRDPCEGGKLRKRRRTSSQSSDSKGLYHLDFNYLCPSFPAYHTSPLPLPRTPGKDINEFGIDQPDNLCVNKYMMNCDTDIPMPPTPGKWLRKSSPKTSQKFDPIIDSSCIFSERFYEDMKNNRPPTPGKYNFFLEMPPSRGTIPPIEPSNRNYTLPTPEDYRPPTPGKGYSAPHLYDHFDETSFDGLDQCMNVGIAQPYLFKNTILTIEDMEYVKLLSPCQHDDKPECHKCKKMNGKQYVMKKYFENNEMVIDTNDNPDFSKSSSSMLLAGSADNSSLSVNCSLSVVKIAKFNDQWA